MIVTRTDAPNSPTTYQVDPSPAPQQVELTHDNGVTTRTDAGGGTTTQHTISNVITKQ